MEISVSGLANLGPPPASAGSSRDVVTPMAEATQKKKEKGGFLKRLVRLGSTREVQANNGPKTTNFGPNPNPTGGLVGAKGTNNPDPKGLPPLGKGPSKKWESPATVFVPPQNPASNKKKGSSTSKATGSNSKNKPPQYIVIGKSTSSFDLMPDNSHTGATVPLDESFNTRNGQPLSSTGAASAAGGPRPGNHVRRLGPQDDDEDADDVNYVWSSVSEASSVSSGSLQDFMEWKIFGDRDEGAGGGGGGGGGGGKDKKSKKKDQLQNKDDLTICDDQTDQVSERPEGCDRSLLQDNPHKEISLLQVANAQHAAPPPLGSSSKQQQEDNPRPSTGRRSFQSSCYKPPMQHESSTTLNTNSLSAPVAMPDQTMFGGRGDKMLMQKDNITREITIEIEPDKSKEKDAAQAAQTGSTSTYDVTEADADEPPPKEPQYPKQQRRHSTSHVPYHHDNNNKDHGDYPFNPHGSNNRRMRPEDDSRRSRSHYPEEQQHRSGSRRNLYADEDSRASYYGDGSRTSSRHDDRRRSNHHAAAASPRDRDLHHPHHHRRNSDNPYDHHRIAAEDDRRHRLPPARQQASNRNLERPAPPMPNDHGHHNQAPPSTRRSHNNSNLNWIQEADNFSYASSPTILEAAKMRNKKASIPPVPRHSHAKDRQRELQRMNEAGQQWFDPSASTGSFGGGGSHHRHHHQQQQQQQHHPYDNHSRASGSASGYHGGESYHTDGGGRAVRPKSPHSQRDLVQIYPGVYVPLRSATETERAIARDFYIHTKCVGCIRDIFCILDAAYVICPQCKFVSALDEEKGRLRHGLGIGFTGKTLCEMKAKARQSATPLPGAMAMAPPNNNYGGVNR